MLIRDTKHTVSCHRARRVAHYVTALVVACSDGIGPDQRLNGTYELMSIAGRPLPTTFDNVQCNHRYARAELRFVSSARVLYVRDLRESCPDKALPREQFEGTYTVDGTAVTIVLTHPDVGGTIPGVLSENRRTLAAELYHVGGSSRQVAIFAIR